MGQSSSEHAASPPWRALWVTRPQPQAQAWVEDLRQRGWPAYALPLIDIRARQDLRPVQAAWALLPTMDLLVFVSPNAVTHFFHQRAWPARFGCSTAGAGDTAGRGPLVAATGPGTVAALSACGVPKARILSPGHNAAQYDAEALWPHVLAARAWQGARVLVVRGTDEGRETREGMGRHWLADQLGAQGATLDYVAAYVRALPRWTACGGGQDAASTSTAPWPGQARQVWLLSSSQAVEHLSRLLAQAAHPDAPCPVAMPPCLDRAVVTHARIAEAAVRAGFEEVRISRPTLADVDATLRSF